MVIAIASGKGGTGKTSVAVSLAQALSPQFGGTEDVQFIDCDVEEPNAGIFLKPELTEHELVNQKVPVFDNKKCTACGLCAEACTFNALTIIKDKVLFFDKLCHSCGACYELCSEKAVSEEDRTIGIIEKGYAGEIDFMNGRLNIGEAMAPPIIRAAKKSINKNKTVIIDVPPGTSCPVVESLKRIDFCLLVSENTPFAYHDLELAIKVIKELKISGGIVINRADVGSSRIRELSEKENIPLLMEIPFSREIAEYYSKGKSIVEALPEYRLKFRQLFREITRLVGK